MSNRPTVFYISGCMKLRGIGCFLLLYAVIMSSSLEPYAEKAPQARDCIIASTHTYTACFCTISSERCQDEFRSDAHLCGVSQEKVDLLIVKLARTSICKVLQPDKRKQSDPLDSSTPRKRAGATEGSPVDLPSHRSAASELDGGSSVKPAVMPSKQPEVISSSTLVSVSKGVTPQPQPQLLDPNANLNTPSEGIGFRVGDQAGHGAATGAIEASPLKPNIQPVNGAGKPFQPVVGLPAPIRSVDASPVQPRTSNRGSASGATSAISGSSESKVRSSADSGSSAGSRSGRGSSSSDASSGSYGIGPIILLVICSIGILITAAVMQKKARTATYF